MEQATTGLGGVQQCWGRVRLVRLLPYFIVGLLLVGAIVFLGREIDNHLDFIEASIAGLGAWSMVAFVVLFVVLTSLLVPDTLLGIIAGALFGLAGGVVAAVIGNLVGAILQFVAARTFFRNRIERMLSNRPWLLAIQRAALRQELRIQTLLRLTPLSQAAISYMLGAAGVRFGTFFLAWFAVIPSLILEVYFGHAGKHLARMAGGSRPTAFLEDAAILGGLVVAAVVMVIVSRMARAAVQEAMNEVGPQ